jgi:hypothetical protein
MSHKNQLDCNRYLLCMRRSKDNSDNQPGSECREDDIFYLVIELDKTSKRTQIITIHKRNAPALPLCTALPLCESSSLKDQQTPLIVARSIPLCPQPVTAAKVHSSKCKYTGFDILTHIECEGTTFVPLNKHVAHLWPPRSCNIICKDKSTSPDFPQQAIVANESVLLHMSLTHEDATKQARLPGPPDRIIAKESQPQYALVQPLDIPPFMDNFGGFMYAYSMIMCKMGDGNNDKIIHKKTRRVILYESDGKFRTLWDAKTRATYAISDYTTFEDIHVHNAVSTRHEASS